jgi:hypothetical protein
MVIGDGQKCRQLIQPSFDFIKEWGYHMELMLEKEEIVSNEKVIARIQEEIVSMKIWKWEKIKRFELTLTYGLLKADSLLLL